MRRVTSPVLVGRRDEIDELLASVTAASPHDGHGGLVLVEGEAGIGKSRLVAEVATRAADAGAIVLAGACLPFADAVPYAALASIVSVLDDGGDASAAPVDAGDRLRFFGWFAERLVRLAAVQPVVVAVEDLHWADESTGDLLLYVSDAVRDSPVTIVATRRPSESERSRGLAVALGELVRSGRARHLVLAPLEPTEVADLIERILGFEPSAGLVARVTERADGNPFFVEELVAAGGGDDLPTTVGDVILQRVARVDPATRDLLRVAAVIGRRTSYALLREVAGTDGAATDAGLRDAVSHQLLVATGDRYAFRHALGHEAVYGDLLPGERAALHERVAEVLSSRPDLAHGDSRAMAAGELAHHWHAAGRLPESLATSVAAARAADVANAPVEAQVHYRRAIELWPRIPHAATVAGIERAELLERAAESASLAGSNHGAVQLVDLLLAELGSDVDADRLARIANRRTLYRWHAGDVTAAGWGPLSGGGDAESAMTLAAAARQCGLAHQAALDLRYVDGLALARDAVVAAGAAGGLAEMSYALHVLGSIEAHIGRYDDGIAHLHRSLDLAREGADAQRVGATWHNLVEAYVFAGRNAEAVSLAEDGLVELERLGLGRTYVVMIAGQLMYALLALGRWADADRHASAALTGDVHPYFALPLRYGRVNLLTRRGRFAEAASVLAELVSTFGHYPYMAGVSAAWHAEIAIWQHDWPAARSALESADAVTATRDEVMLELRLAALAARLEADAWEWGGPGAAGRDLDTVRRRVGERVDRAAAYLGRIEAAAECCSLPLHGLLRAARAEQARLTGIADVAGSSGWERVAASAGPDAYLFAYARWRAAEAAMADSVRHGRGRADAALQVAARHAAELGAAPLAAAVADLARRARVTIERTDDHPTTRADDESPDEFARLGLTARELEVLRLLGEGLSNREIGDALFISAKTASVHVTHILQKLGVSTRVQAAVAASRLGPARTAERGVG